MYSFVYIIFKLNNTIITLDVHMSKRVTIMIDDDLDKKIRLKQAKLIQKTNQSVSFSNVINETIRKCL